MHFKHITVVATVVFAISYWHVISKETLKHNQNETVSHMLNNYQLYHTQNIKLGYKIFRVLGTS